MAKSSYVGVQIANTSSFQDWIDETNNMLEDFATVVMTTELTANGGQTTGNAHIEGILSANTIVAKDGLRGGTISTPADLVVVSNTIFQGSNLTLDSNSNITASGNVSLNGATKSLYVNTLSANIDSTTVNFNGDAINISDGATVSVAGDIVFTGDDSIFRLPSGNTASRPSGNNGIVRYNEDEDYIEGYVNGSWTNILSGVTSDEIIYSANNLSDVANTYITRDNIGISSKVITKSGAYTAVLGDRSKLIRTTSTMTLSLDAAATLKDGWYIDVVATSGTLTIDPNSTEQIDGSSTITINEGESARIKCDGTGFYSQYHVDFSAFAESSHTHTISDLPEATSAQFRNNTADKVLSTDQVWSAASLVTLTDASSIALNMNSGINFEVTLGGNRTLSNPTNTKVGQSGVIIVKQDATGSRTLSFGSNYEFGGGVAPTLSTGANDKDVLSYFVESSTSIIISYILDVS